MIRLNTRAAALLALLAPLTALAGQPVEIQVYDRTAGRMLPVYWHDGERHVAGEPGHEYEVRIRNREGGRVLAVTSVDGVNVITGQTARARQSGYVIDPYGSVDIDGWRKSMAEVAAFYFTSLADSYAARTGRPDNVGVIGIAVFRERQRHPAPRYQKSVPAAEAQAASGMMDSREREERLGTGHGQRLDSSATYVDFQRASSRPDAVITIYYDSYRNLVARGVIPKPRHRYAKRVPEPFPGGFVPDP
ncbi:MAG TPA: hypothetical protein VFR29_09435 [Steroidobacteraceae bacterium]|nr:hypothetical protein [Steroidobacteraceae bacterium]